MIWHIEVPTRPTEPEQPASPVGTEDRSVYNEAIAKWREEHEAWAKQVAIIDAIAHQPIKAVYSIADVGGGRYLASVDIEISGKIERVDYCYAPAVPDAAKAHVQMAGLHQSLAAYIEQPAPPTKAELAAYAGEVAWRVEVSGKTVSGVAVKWDDRSKILLMGAASTMSDDEVADYVAGAVVVTLTGAQFKNIYAAMVSHTKACFAKRAEVLGLIIDGSLTTTADIDAAFATV